MQVLQRSCGKAFTSRQTNAAVISRPQLMRKSTTTSALMNIFKSGSGKKATSRKPQYETVVLEPSYNLQLALLAIAGGEAYQGWYPVAAFTGLLGAFLLYQTTRVKFVFDDEALEIKIGGQDSENVVVGGANRWPYSSFINWELWFPAFPVLVYFKENQTKEEGQIHFFPIIFNGKQLYDVMVERCGPSATSGPK